MQPFGKHSAKLVVTPSYAFSAGSGGGARARDAGSDKCGTEGRSGVPLSWIERQRLKRAIPVYDHEIDDVPLVLERLRRALKGEDERGRKQHWSYDQNRHMALMKFLRMYESWSAAA